MKILIFNMIVLMSFTHSPCFLKLIDNIKNNHFSISQIKKLDVLKFQFGLERCSSIFLFKWHHLETRVNKNRQEEQARNKLSQKTISYHNTKVCVVTEVRESEGARSYPFSFFLLNLFSVIQLIVNTFLFFNYKKQDSFDKIYGFLIAGWAFKNFPFTGLIETNHSYSTFV